MDEMVKQLKLKGFTNDQIEEIRNGIEEGIDVKKYARKEFLAVQMQQIRLGLVKGLPVDQYARIDYDWFQMEEIRKGLEEGIDISVYASPDISYDRMQQIRLGLGEGIDFSAYKRLDAGVLKEMRLAVKNKVNLVPYIITGYDAEQLEAIRNALEKGIDIQPWVQKEYRGVALQEIFAGLEEGLDVAVYANIAYSWQQMRELRIGMEHMIDIEQYRNVFYSYGQMQEIRLGLEAGLDVSYYKSMMYTASEMKKRRLYLEENPVVLSEEQFADMDVSEISVNGTDTSEHCTLTITEDEMYAYLEIHGSAVTFDKIDLLRILRENGICYGIRYDMIEDVVRGNSLRKPLLIASGKEAVDGTDGWYEYFFPIQNLCIPKQLEDGSVDYRDVDRFTTVEKGQKLAFYHSAQHGENGITIKGNVVPAKRGREKNMLTGKGIKRLSDGKTYISKLQGIVSLEDYHLDVSELLIVDEVNMATGDVDYNGNVLVEGNVSSGSKIKASKDIIVKGFVEAAQIICGGSVFLRKGMNGSGSGKIQAAKDVTGYFFEDTEVYAGGDILGNYFFKSELHAQGSIKAIGRKGTIVGGRACAEAGLRANNLGNPTGIPTSVKIGTLDRLKQKEEKLNEEIRGINQELAAFQNIHKEFQKKFPPEIRNTMELYLKIESAIYTKEKQLEKIFQEKRDLNEAKMKSGTVTAVVDGQVYEGVSVEIDGVCWNAKNVKCVTIKKVNGNIALYSNNHP